MQIFSAERTINASPERIWQILVDGDSYPQWDPAMDRVEGSFALGEEMKFFTKLSPDRAFPAKITVFEPGQKMVLSSGMPLGLFKTERTHALIPEGDSIKFTTREEFSGPLLFLFGRSLPDLNKIFDDFAAGLKTRAEDGDQEDTEAVDEAIVPDMDTTADEEE